MPLMPRRGGGVKRNYNSLYFCICKLQNFVISSSHQRETTKMNAQASIQQFGDLCVAPRLTYSGEHIAAVARTYEGCVDHMHSGFDSAVFVREMQDMLGGAQLIEIALDDARVGDVLAFDMPLNKFRTGMMAVMTSGAGVDDRQAKITGPSYGNMGHCRQAWLSGFFRLHLTKAYRFSTNEPA